MSESTEPKPFLSGVMGAIVVVCLTFVVVGGGFVALLASGASHGETQSGEAGHGAAHDSSGASDSTAAAH